MAPVVPARLPCRAGQGSARMKPLPEPEDREVQYKVVDAIVYLVLLVTFVGVVCVLFPAGCASPTAPEEPSRPPRPPRPGVCWGNTPGCVSL